MVIYQSYQFQCHRGKLGTNNPIITFILGGVCFICLLSFSVDCDGRESVLFKDFHLRSVIRNIVNANGDILNHQDVKGIKVLRADHSNISNIEGLHLLTNLIFLDLSGNNISDITPLGNLNNLKSLNLNDNHIKTIEPLKNLLSLNRLDLSHNQIKNVDALNLLEKLEVLDLRYNLISSIKTIRRLDKIPRAMFLHGNPVTSNISLAQYYNEIRLTGLDPSLRNYNSHYPLLINEVMASTSNAVNREKKSSDWIEIYNTGKRIVNLNGFGLSDKINQPLLWRFPNVSISPDEHLLIWASGYWDISSKQNLHTNFKINKNGEPILLTDPTGNVVDGIRVPASHRNISFGRRGDGRNEWVYFENPTPKRSNAYLNFSYEAGFYTDTIYLRITSSEKDAKIYYSLDGSIPDENSQIYQQPIKISSKIGSDCIFANIRNTSMDWAPSNAEIFKGTIVRAIQYIDGQPLGKTITKTYLIDPEIFQRYSFPVVSLVTDPKNLFDFSKGIYVFGKQFTNYIKENPDYAQGVKKKLVEGNYSLRGRGQERPVHIEFFEPNGLFGVSQHAGLRIFGGNYNRKLSQKPMILYARKQYDHRNYFSYEFFPDLKKSKTNQKILRKFKHIVLRTSGQDYNKSMFADALMQDLICSKLDVQAYRPVTVFLNGEYWGIYNMREHLDDHYLQTHYDIPKKHIALLERYIEVKSGDDNHRKEFLGLLDYFRQQPLSIPSNYRYIAECIDIDNFMDYSISQIYFNNKDWPVNNIRYWKKYINKIDDGTSYGHDGKWRWLIYDTDYGFGISGGLRAFQYNMVKKATEAGQKGWPNPDRSTLILRSLLENNEFKMGFINRFADYLNTIFKEAVVTEKIVQFEKMLARELPEHINRWGGSTRSIQSIENWQKKIRRLIDFGKKRPRWVRKHLNDHFGLNGLARVTLNITPPEGGYVKINTINTSAYNYPWEGIYFKDVPIRISAVAHEGYRFSGWEGDNITGFDNVELTLDSDLVLTASFTEYRNE